MNLQSQANYLLINGDSHKCLLTSGARSMRKKHARLTQNVMFPDKNYLLKLACEFRRAFETVDLSRAPGVLPHFPRGCCGWATIFIGNFLQEEYGLLAQHVGADHRQIDGNSHEWLMVNGISIDITADQYPDAPSGIIVESDSQWHKGWPVSEVKDVKSIAECDKIVSHRDQLPSEIYGVIKSRVRDAITSQYYHKQRAT